MMAGVRRCIGVLLLALAAVHLGLTVGDLLSSRSVERQLVEAVPSAEASLADPAARSRHKSYYAVASVTALGIAGAWLTLAGAGARPRAA
jgi:hypothetical protein